MTYVELKDELLDNARTQEEADLIKQLSKAELEERLCLIEK